MGPIAVVQFVQCEQLQCSARCGSYIVTSALCSARCGSYIVTSAYMFRQMWQLYCDLCLYVPPDVAVIL